MSLFDDWSRYVAAVLAAESSLAGGLVKHPTTLGDARETLIRGVLGRVLPSAYEVGSGHVIDSERRQSDQIDVVIARRDFPILRMADGSAIYPVESVLAAIEVKSELTPSKLALALSNCASVADLTYSVVAGSEDRVLEELGARRDPVTRAFSHALPIEQERIDCLARPATYIYAFRGYGSDSKAFVDALSRWGETRVSSPTGLRMRHVPCVVAAGGCFAWRNDAPFSFRSTGTPADTAYGLVGCDETPLRLLILHLLFSLQRAVTVQPRVDGIIPNLAPHLAHIKPPHFERWFFEAPRVPAG